MLKQDSINEVIREVNVRIECVNGIEYIPQKRMVEADNLNFILKTETCKDGNKGSIFTLQRSSGRVPSTTEICRSCLLRRRCCPRALSPAYTNQVCEVAIAEAKECTQRIQSMFEKAAADTTDTFRYVLVGAPRNLVSVGGEYSVDLAICERLIESGSGSFLKRMVIACFPTQDGHVTSTPCRRGWRQW